MKTANLFIYFITILFLGTACSWDQANTKIFENPANSNGKYPFLYANGDDLYMSWIESHPEKPSSTLKYARYQDGSWHSPVTIAEDSTWFINWADFPSIVADENGPVAAHWLDKIPGGPYAYNVNISTAQSPHQWSKAIVPHADSTATEHGFVSMIPWNNNTILAVWLDGRRTANRSEKEYYDLDKAMTLRGALVSKSGNVENTFLIDESVCDCCQTSLIKTPEGAVVAYRNRTDDEIRDIYISRFDGSQWSDPKAVHNDGWKIAACPVNGPVVTADGSMIAVAWHTGSNNNPRSQVAVSTDFGKTFSNPMVLNQEKSMGRVDVALRDGHVYSTWIEEHPENTNQANLKLAHFEATDSTANNITISTLSSDRATGFPQMELLNNQLIFAWTKLDSAGSNIKTLHADLPLDIES